MKPILIVAVRELRQRWLLVPVAAVLGVAALIAHQPLPAFLASLAIAGFAGINLAAGDLGWYFTRPLAGAAIWGGKLLAGAVLAVAVAALATLPALATTKAAIEPWELAVLPITFVSAGAAFGLMARAKSRWLALDLAGMLLLGSVMPWAGHRFHDLSELAVILVGTAAFLAGSGVGVIVGRADARRAHAAASIALWGIIAPAQIALLVYGLVSA